jgi:hypothetical protein
MKERLNSEILDFLSYWQYFNKSISVSTVNNFIESKCNEEEFLKSLELHQHQNIINSLTFFNQPNVIQCASFSISDNVSTEHVISDSGTYNSLIIQDCIVLRASTNRAIHNRFTKSGNNLIQDICNNTSLYSAVVVWLSFLANNNFLISSSNNYVFTIECSLALFESYWTSSNSRHTDSTSKTLAADIFIDFFSFILANKTEYSKLLSKFMQSNDTITAHTAYNDLILIVQQVLYNVNLYEQKHGMSPRWHLLGAVMPQLLYDMSIFLELSDHCVQVDPNMNISKCVDDKQLHMSKFNVLLLSKRMNKGRYELENAICYFLSIRSNRGKNNMMCCYASELDAFLTSNQHVTQSFRYKRQHTRKDARSKLTGMHESVAKNDNVLMEVNDVKEIEIHQDSEGGKNGKNCDVEEGEVSESDIEGEDGEIIEDDCDNNTENNCSNCSDSASEYLSDSEFTNQFAENGNLQIYRSRVHKEYVRIGGLSGLIKHLSHIIDWRRLENNENKSSDNSNCSVSEQVKVDDSIVHSDDIFILRSNSTYVKTVFIELDRIANINQSNLSTEETDEIVRQNYNLNMTNSFVPLQKPQRKKRKHPIVPSLRATHVSTYDMILEERLMDGVTANIGVAPHPISNRKKKTFKKLNDKATNHVYPPMHVQYLIPPPPPPHIVQHPVEMYENAFYPLPNVSPAIASLNRFPDYRQEQVNIYHIL